VNVRLTPVGEPLRCDLYSALRVELEGNSIRLIRDCCTVELTTARYAAIVIDCEAGADLAPTCDAL